MASASGIRAGGAFVEITATTASLRKGLDNAAGMLRAWGSSLTSIGTSVFTPFAAAGVAGVGSMIALGQTIGDIGGTIDDTAQRTGLTTEAVSELGYAAEMAGADLPTLESGLVKMQRALAAASDGSKGANDALADLGLSLGDLSSKSQDEQFATIAERIASIEDPAKKTAAAMAIFGKAGQKLLPVLNGGADGIAEMRQQARDLGVSMSQADATAAADFGDTVEDLQRSVKAAGFTLAATLAPAIGGFVKQASQAIGAVSNWIKQNRGLILAVAAGVAGVVALGAGVSALGVAFSLGGVAISAVITLVTTLLSPIGLAVAAVVGLGVAFVALTDTGRQMFGDMVASVQAFATEAIGAFGAIGAALAAGDIQAAWDVATAYLQLQWERATGAIETVWQTSVGYVLGVWDTATTSLAIGLTNAVAAIETVWTQVTSFLGDAWDMAITRIQNAWRVAVKYISSGVGYLLAKLQNLDPAEVVAEIQSSADQDINQANTGLNQRINQREQARKDRIATIEANRTGANDTLRSDLANRAAVRGANGDKQSQELAAAQKRLAEAVQRANALQKDSISKQTAGGAGAARAGIQQAALNSSRASATDVRTSEGLKAVLDLIGGTRRDPIQEEIASNTADAADTADDQLTVMREINSKLTVGLPA